MCVVVFSNYMPFDSQLVTSSNGLLSKLGQENPLNNKIKAGF